RYRRLGWTAPASTLDSAWRWGTDLLDPIADVVRGEVLRESYVQADSTTLMVLDPLHPNGRFRAQIWTFVSKAGVAFDLTPSSEAQAIAPAFAVNWDAFRQVDDYKGYGSIVEVEGMRRQLVPEQLRLGCMMHVRRRFHETFEAKDLRAAVPLELIRRLYDVESDAKTLDVDARLALRTDRSRPILDELRAWLDAHADEPPKSLLGGAVRYARDQWPHLERCFSRGEFEIDNGAAKREIRSVAIGRRNFLFLGSVDLDSTASARARHFTVAESPATRRARERGRAPRGIEPGLRRRDNAP
ncbi:MAG: IS66 family transposase, partial [Polyangiaceae bacterium]|nr:IS66 family transposase [Polyangiaceae bacterium]